MAITKTVEITPTRTCTTYDVDTSGTVVHNTAGRGLVTLVVNPTMGDDVEVFFSCSLPSRVNGLGAVWVPWAAGTVNEQYPDVFEGPVTAIKIICDGPTNIEIVE